MRKLALALACTSILGTSNAQAMGLGEVAVRSYLNQPLRAEIPLVDVSAEELERIRVRLANAQSFERHGFSLGAVSGLIQIQVQGGKHPHVLLTSKAPIHDPVLAVVLELEGPDGVIQRSYDILLDPVNYRPPLVIAASTLAQSETVPMGDRTRQGKQADLGETPAPSLALQGGMESGHYRVREGETLWRVAYNLRPPGVSTEQMMAALRDANPQAFIRSGKTSTLLAGALLRIPTAEEIRQARVRKADAPVPPKPLAETAPPAAVAAKGPGEPKLTIVPPAQAQPSAAAPVVGEQPSAVAPVVGEVAAPAAAPAAAVSEPQPRNAATGESVQLQEQLEAVKVEKEQLLQRLHSVEGQMQKMEELLHLKDEQIKQLEQLVQSKTTAAEKAEKTLATKTEDTRPPVTLPPASEAQTDLLASLNPFFVLGAAGLAALLLALLFIRLRRRREQGLAQATPLVSPTETATAAKDMPSAAVAGAAAVAKGVAAAEEEGPSEALIDPVQAVLEEVDVMQAYGLHDRARQVLDDAILRMPQADVLQARRVRLLHEMGAREEFLRAAEDYRRTHPAADDPHWASIQAIGMAAYADAPLFKGADAQHLDIPASSFKDITPEDILGQAYSSTAAASARAQASAPIPEAIAESQLTGDMADSSPKKAQAFAPLALDLDSIEFGPASTAPAVQAISSKQDVHAPSELEPLALDLEGFTSPLAQTQAEPAAAPPAAQAAAFSTQEARTPIELEPLTLEGLTLASTPMQAEPSSVAPAAQTASSGQGAHADEALELLTLEWPMPEPNKDETAKDAAPVIAPELPVFAEQALSREPATAQAAAVPSTSTESAARKPTPLESLPDLKLPTTFGTSVGQDISEDDLMLLGLDTTSLEETPSLDLADLLASTEPQPMPAMAKMAEVERAPATSALQSLDLEKAQKAPAPASMSSAATTPPSLEGMSEQKVTVPTSPASMATIDERALKLDTAEALLDLGELEEARSMLEEVLLGGNDELSARARDMLACSMPG